MPVGDRQTKGLVGRAKSTGAKEIQGPRVAADVHREIDRSPYVRHLAEIHAAPFWLRPALVAALVAKGWPVEKVREQVADPCCRRRPDRHYGRKDERAEQRGTPGA